MTINMKNGIIAIACAVTLLAGCNERMPSAYAGQQLQLTPEQIQAMTPEQLQAVIMAQQAQQPVQQMAAPAPAAPAAAPQESGMSAVEAGLLGAAGGALVGGLVGNSLGKSSATANAALANSHAAAPQVVHRTTVIKKYVQAPTPAAASPARQSIGTVNNKPMSSAPKFPSASKTFRASSARRR